MVSKFVEEVAADGTWDIGLFAGDGLDVCRVQQISTLIQHSQGGCWQPPSDEGYLSFPTNFEPMESHQMSTVMAISVSQVY